MSKVSVRIMFEDHGKVEHYEGSSESNKKSNYPLVYPLGKALASVLRSCKSNIPPYLLELFAHSVVEFDEQSDTDALKILREDILRTEARLVEVKDWLKKLENIMENRKG